MRITELFGKTQREIPAEADTISHQLLLRAGMIRQVAAGVYSYLPLARRALKKIEDIIRDEMDKAGGQELLMPALQPVELWQQTGRHEAMGDMLFKLTDRRERPLVLGPTHEEAITEIVKYNVQSYRDLPQLLYQIQTKFRDEPRPRAGLVRAREFIMKDLYSFDSDEEGLNISYEKMRQAYQNIFDRCGLPTVLVEADSGAIGGKESKEFMLVTDSGEDEIIHCACGYAANMEKAVSVKRTSEGGELLHLETVNTPGAQTIEELTAFFNIRPDRILKAVFYIANNEFIVVAIRGDLEVNEVKLKNVLHCTDLRLASDEEVKWRKNLVTGAASPVIIHILSKSKTERNELLLQAKKFLKINTIIADDSVSSGTNFIAGGNKQGVHLKNVNYPRDFEVDILADIAKSRDGDTCSKCGGTLTVSRGLELGHIFKLGTFYTEKMGAKFIDKDGQSRPIIMGCYGIGPSRLLAAVIERHNDEKGIIWPPAVAPFQIHLCPLYREGSAVAETTNNLYKELRTAGVEALMDDRAESPGVKFNDADLLGIPLRVTISPRSLEKNSLEVKRRTDKSAEMIPVEGAVKQLLAMLSR